MTNKTAAISPPNCPPTASHAPDDMRRIMADDSAGDIEAMNKQKVSHFYVTKSVIH